MRGKQAKILSDDNLEDLLLFAETSRHPLRNKVIVLLSAKAGLRAGEIARLTWAMVTDPTGAIGTVLELPDRVAKKRSGRVIPLHEDLRTALAAWRAAIQSAGPVIVSERGGPMTPLERRNLVCQRLSAHWSGRLLVPFRAPHLHHPRCPPRPRSRRVTTRRSTASRASVDPNNAAVHRRRHRCPAQARVADLSRRRFEGLPRETKDRSAKSRRTLEIRVTADSMDHWLWTTPWTTNPYLPIPISRTPCRWCTPRAALPGRHRILPISARTCATMASSAPSGTMTRRRCSTG